MLLDTCALLWLAEGGALLSEKAREGITVAPAVYVSAISGFEVGLKYRNGKLELPAPPGVWFKQVVDHHDLAVLPLDAEICVAAAELPAFHKDPCDRFIIATARLNNLAVITGDPRFGQYGVEVVW